MPLGRAPAWAARGALAVGLALLVAGCYTRRSLVLEPEFSHEQAAVVTSTRQESKSWLSPNSHLTTDVDATGFLLGLYQQQRLPGLPKESLATMEATLKLDESPASYPVSRTFRFSVDGESGSYLYTVERLEAGGDWSLKRAWKVNADGQVVREFQIH